MPLAKPGELRGLPETELRQKLLETRKELAALRLKVSQGSTEQPHQIRRTRRHVARILTVLRERP